MFCIIRCPRCGNVQGSRYPVKRTKCMMCQYSIDMSKMEGMRIFGSHDDMQKTLQALKKKDREIDDDISKEERSSIDGKRSLNRGDIRDMILRITTCPTSRTDLQNSLKNQGIDKKIFDEELEKLLISGDIYCPKDGFLKSVVS